MSDIKARVQSIDPNIKARNIHELIKDTGNIYESLNVIAKRASHIALDLKKELHGKLDEFSVTTDTIEEIHENKEQIEISKFYERLPNPVIIASEEFLGDKITYDYSAKNDKSDD